MNAFHNLWLHAVALHLWQATLFGLAIGAGLVALPGAPARLRHFAGWLALLRFLLPAGLFASLTGSLHWAALGGVWLPARVGGLWMPAFIVSGNAPETQRALLLPLTVVLAAIWSLGTVLLLGAGTVRLIRGLRELLPMGAIHLRSGEVVLRVGEPISTIGMDASDRTELTGRLYREVSQLLGEGSLPFTAETQRR